MKIASPATLAWGDWLALATQAWLARCVGQLVLAPIRSSRRTIAIAPRFSLTLAMGGAL